MKNASSAQTCYNGAKRKFLGSAGAAASVSSLVNGVSIPGSSTSAPAAKKRKPSAKTNTSKASKGTNGKASTTAAARDTPVTHYGNDDDAFDADDDDEEEMLEVKNIAAIISDAAAAEAADLQLKVDQEAHAVKESATTFEGERLTGPVKVEVIKAEDDEGKAMKLLLKAQEMAAKAIVGNSSSDAKKDADGASLAPPADSLDTTVNGTKTGVTSTANATALPAQGKEVVDEVHEV